MDVLGFVLKHRKLVEEALEQQRETLEGKAGLKSMDALTELIGQLTTYCAKLEGRNETLKELLKEKESEKRNVIPDKSRQTKNTYASVTQRLVTNNT